MSNNLPVDLKNNWQNNEIVMPADMNAIASNINTVSNLLPQYASNGSYYVVDSFENNIYNLVPITYPDGTQNVSPTAYYDGMEVVFFVKEANTTTTYIKVGSLETKQIKNFGNKDLSKSDLKQYSIATLRYNTEQDCFYLIKSGAGSMRNLLEFVQSPIPLSDACLHLADGSLLEYGVYKELIDEIPNLMAKMPQKNWSTVMGSPSVDDVGRNVWNFSKGNYIYVCPVTIPYGSTWEYVTLRHTGEFSRAQALLGIGNQNEKVTDCLIGTDGKIQWWASSNGADWDIAEGISSTYALSPNTVHWFKMSFDGKQYKVKVWGEYETEDKAIDYITVDSTTPVNSNTVPWDIGAWIGTDDTYDLAATGTINLEYSWISINGQKAYSPWVPQGFTREDGFQSEIADHGTCGYFVYDAINKTLRLPRISGFTEATIDGIVGAYTQAGLPDHAHHYNRSIFRMGHGGEHPLTGYAYETVISGYASGTNPIYGRSNTVQPASTKTYMYVVVGTAVKADIQVNIDNIVTDLNAKADINLSNLTTAGTTAIAHYGMPSDRYIDLTLGASETTYTAPADGYVGLITSVTNTTGYYVANLSILDIYGVVLARIGLGTYGYYRGGTITPIHKGQKFQLIYESAVTVEAFKFIYPEGAY